ncbi:MAG: gliding motility-associated C-terminal domain-containing protein [Paludibacteraceae bacterium]|nr:gliding motility-associated C-terminal domain-containing protein [Paludibacteraceae bacterium]
MNKTISRKVILTLSLLTFGFSLMAINFEKLNTELDDYYVKVDGTGDGSSWDKAMGNKEFSYMLGHAREGATFHLAAGTYVPVLNSAYEETNSVSRKYLINRPVSIIGGYPENPTEKDVSNPQDNITLFTSDVNGDNEIEDLENNREDDLEGCLYIDRVDGKVLLYGLQFGGTANHGSSPADFNAVCYMYSSVVDVENCSFLGCHNPLKIERCDATITNCIFSYNNNSFVTSIGDVKITSTTFKNEGYTTICSSYRYGYMGGGIDEKKRNVSVTNCTFKDVKNLTIGSTSDSDHTKYYFNNNTILMDEGSVTLCCMTTMTGNIISALRIILRGKSYGKMVQPLYNVICTNDLDDDQIIMSESNNIRVNSCSSFLSTELKENGGYTPTLALKTDVLSMGKSLRFPLSETTVTSDQRYMKRSQKTCVGAYELDATEIVPVVRYVLSDTILACDVYPLTGKSYPIGCNEVRETIKNDRGKDSLVLVHPVYVLPDPAQKVYYVKQNGEGDKSGRSWNNAMSDSSFAYALLKLNSDDVTFHIAEGVYKPIYDSLGGIPEVKKKCIFYVKRNVSLIGGYSASNPSSTPDPSRYITTFNGDMQGEYVYYILRYKSLKNKEVNVQGIKFINSSCGGESDEGALVLSATQGCVFSIEKCTFENVCRGIEVNIAQSGRDNSDLKVIVKDCYSKSDMQLGGENTIIENSSFVSREFSLYGKLENLNIKNSTFVLEHFDIGMGGNDKNAFSAQFVNNTILLKNKLSLMKGVYSLVGNIIKADIDMAEYSNVSSSYNAYSKENEQYVFISKKDILLDDDQLNLVLDNADGEWVCKQNGGFAPTVAPLTDSLSDGTTILFPLSETSVVTDQRGRKRNELTCMGACELISETETDTIIPISLNGVPTLFTPYNLNGKNDIFMPGYEVYIYNVYGGLICHSTNGWDGKKNDEFLPAGTYVYVLMMGDEKKKGTVILSR